jgi:hypothetical protein
MGDPLRPTPENPVLPHHGKPIRASSTAQGDSPGADNGIYIPFYPEGNIFLPCVTSRPTKGDRDCSDKCHGSGRDPERTNIDLTGDQLRLGNLAKRAIRGVGQKKQRDAGPVRSLGNTARLLRERSKGNSKDKVTWLHGCGKFDAGRTTMNDTGNIHFLQHIPHVTDHSIGPAHPHKMYGARLSQTINHLRQNFHICHIQQ